MKSTYTARWGHPRRTKAHHPKRKARQDRAYARGAPRPKVRA